MADGKNIGAWIVGALAGLVVLSKQKLSFGIQGVYVDGLITAETLPLRVVAYIKNDTIGSVLVRSLSGVLVSNEGKTIASIMQPINKRIRAKSNVVQDILIDIHNKEVVSALQANIASGNINNLSFELIGEVVVGEQWPIGLKFNKVFTWQDIKQML